MFVVGYSDHNNPTLSRLQMIALRDVLKTYLQEQMLGLRHEKKPSTTIGNLTIHISDTIKMTQDDKYVSFYNTEHSAAFANIQLALSEVR